MKKYLPHILIIFLAFVCFNLLSSRVASESRYLANLKAQNDSIKYFKNKYSQEVASKTALQLTINELKHVSKENDTLREAIKKFKKPNTIIETKQVVRVDTIYQTFKDTIKDVFNKDFLIDNKYYSFNLNLTQNGFNITNLNLYNDQTIISGWKSNGLFKNPSASVEITNTNPYFKQTKIKPIIITYKKKWHEKWYITIPSALTFGYLLSK